MVQYSRAEEEETHGQTGVLYPVTLEIRCGEREEGEMLKITLGLSLPLL